MFKLLAFFALLACALCAPAPEPRTGLLTYPAAPLPLSYDYRYPALAPTYNYAKAYAYSGNYGYAYAPQAYISPTQYYYNAAPLEYVI
ncbi:unnamed protein product [Ceutorhynchus assimilis]|uniref:Cuticle protein n=1 Tax=Ceutorhynchus assimilis TaxID=467358 RepID=A0A9N9MVB2_9CUCU|nr:unnamed protein product [Ceutorhynchus assimilis]